MANNPIYYIDPDGMEIRIHYNDDDYIVYAPGMDYDGDNKFVSTIVNTLNEINELEYGQTVISRLTDDADNIFSITDDFGSVENSYEFRGKEGGAIIKAAAILSGSFDQGVENLGHELFHGYQLEMGQSPFSIDSEVGATLFGKSLRLGFSFYQGQDPQASLQYSQAMSNLLMARDFNLTDFQKAVNNFNLN